MFVPLNMGIVYAHRCKYGVGSQFYAAGGSGYFVPSPGILKTWMMCSPEPLGILAQAGSWNGLGDVNKLLTALFESKVGRLLPHFAKITVNCASSSLKG